MIGSFAPWVGVYAESPILLYGIDDRLERFRVVHGQVSQYLTVQFNIILFQLVHEAGIRHPVHAGTCVDTGDPQATESALLVLAVAVGVE